MKHLNRFIVVILLTLSLVAIHKGCSLMIEDQNKAQIIEER